LLLIGRVKSEQTKTILVVADAEGVGGVSRQYQTDPEDQEMR